MEYNMANSATTHPTAAGISWFGISWFGISWF